MEQSGKAQEETWRITEAEGMAHEYTESPWENRFHKECGMICAFRFISEFHRKGSGCIAGGTFSVDEKRNPSAQLVEVKALAMNRNLLCYNEKDLAVAQSNE